MRPGIMIRCSGRFPQREPSIQRVDILDWKLISKNKGIPWTHSFIIKYQNKIDWNYFLPSIFYQIYLKDLDDLELSKLVEEYYQVSGTYQDNLQFKEYNQNVRFDDGDFDRNDNDEYYNPDLDLDQQDPDFYV